MTIGRWSWCHFVVMAVVLSGCAGDSGGSGADAGEEQEINDAASSLDRESPDMGEVSQDSLTDSTTDGLPDSTADSTADATMDATTDLQPDLPSIAQKIPGVLFGYSEYDFLPRGLPQDLTNLAQAMLVAGLEEASLYAEYHGIDVDQEGVSVILKIGRPSGSGELQPEDLVAAGATEIAAYGEHGWYHLPLTGLVALVQDPDLVDLSGLWIPQKPDTKPIYQGPVFDFDWSLNKTGLVQCHNKGLSGEGVKVLIIDSGFAGYEDSVAAGRLPSDTARVEDYTNFDLDWDDENHGTMVAEVIHRAAPGAQLYLALLENAEVVLPDAVDWAIENNVDVISASWAYFNHSFYDGTGRVSEQARRAWDAGIVWVSSSGNYAKGVHWHGAWADEDGDGQLDFAPGDETNTIPLVDCQDVVALLSWDDWDQTDVVLEICMDVEAWAFDEPDNRWTETFCSVDDVWGHFTAAEGLHIAVCNSSFCEADPDEYLCFGDEVDLRVVVSNHTKTQPPAGMRMSLISTTMYGDDALEHHHLDQHVFDPACDEAIITVGAIHQGDWEDGVPADYSSFGPTFAGVQKPELVAPAGLDTSIGEFFGTSASTPMVAGAVAMYLEIFPDASPDEVKAFLLETAAPSPGPIPDQKTGFGKLIFDCATLCVPSCFGKECGDDGCGGSCGDCGGPDLCDDYICVCQPICDGKDCGGDGCGGSCGTCAGSEICVIDQCQCLPICAGLTCGADSCGGSCGLCGPGEFCAAGTCHEGTCEDEDGLPWDGCTGGVISGTLVEDNIDAEGQDVDLAGLDDGRFVVTWRSYGNAPGEDAVFTRLYGADGQPVWPSVPAVEGVSLDPESHPTVGMFSDGGFVVAWSEEGDLETRVRFRRFGPDGIPEGPAEDVTGSTIIQYRTRPALAVLPGDLFLIIWEDEEQDAPGQYDLQARAFYPGGGYASTVLNINEETAGDQRAPAVAPCHDDAPCDYLVAWTTDEDGSPELRARTFTLDAPVGAAVAPALWTEGPVGDPAIARGGAPDLLLTWATGDSFTPGADGAAGGISARALTNDLTLPGDELQVPMDPSENQYGADVAAMGSSPSYVVAWTSIDGAFNSGIWARVYSGDEAPVGAPFRVSTPGLGQDWRPAVAGLGELGFVVAWVHLDAATGKRDIMVRRYQDSGAAMPSACEADCDGISCGADGCGGSCGACSAGSACFSGACQDVACSDGNGTPWDGCTDGALSGELVGGPAPLQGEAVDIVGGEEGSLVLAWRTAAAEPEETTVWTRRFNADGAAPWPPWPVAQGSSLGADVRPVVGLFSDGGWVVAWAESGAQTSNIRLRFFGADGLPDGEAFDVHPGVEFGYRSQPAVAVLPDDRFVVVWRSIEGLGDYDVWHELFTRNGAGLFSPARAHDEIAGVQNQPSVAPCHGSQFCDYIVAWTDHAESDGELWVRTFADGAPLEDAAPVNQFQPGTQTDVALAMGPMPNLLLTWTSGDSLAGGADGDGGGVSARVVDTGLSIDAPEFVVNEIASGEQVSADVAANGATNGYAVAWASETPAGSFELRARLFDLQAAAEGPSFQVNDPGTGQDWAPAVARLGNLGFAVAWTHEDPEQERHVMLRRFGTNGAPLESPPCVTDCTGGGACGADGCGGVCGQGCSAGTICAGGACLDAACVDPDPGDPWDGCDDGAAGPVDLDPTGGVDEEAVAVAGRDDGGFVAAWCSTASGFTGKERLELQVFGPDGLAVGERVPVYEWGEDCATPTLGVFSDRGFVVAWEQPGENQNRVLYQLFSAGGVPLGDPADVAPAVAFQYRSFPAAAVLPDDRFVVTWVGSEGLGDNDVWHRAFDREGVPLFDAQTAHDDLEGLQGDPAVAPCQEGLLCDYVVAWAGPAEDEPDIWIRTFLDGEGQEPPVRVNLFTPGNQVAPALATGIMPDFLLAWTSGDNLGSGADGDSSGIAVRQTNIGLVMTGAEELANQDPLGLQYAPAAAQVGTLGRYVVAWTHLAQIDYEIRARLYDQQEQPLGAPFQVSAETTGKDWVPAVARLGDHGFVVAWTREEPGGQRKILYRRFEAGGKPWSVGACYPKIPALCPDCCDDDKPCTLDSCDSQEGCQHLPSDALCDDDLICTTDHCDAETGCVFSPVVCDDGIDCTEDTCGEIFGCLPFPDDDACDDDDPCTEDTCDIEHGCVSSPLPDGAACGDGFTCQDGACVEGCEPPCDDGNECTVDTCDGGCVYTPVPDDTPCAGDQLCKSGVCAECDDSDGIQWDGCTEWQLSEFQVNTYTTMYQQYPAIAAEPSGSFIIAWAGSGPVDQSGVFARRYGPDGTAEGDQFRVNSLGDDGENQSWPTLSYLPGGRAVIAWSGHGVGDSDGVYARCYAADGTEEGAEFLVNHLNLTQVQDRPELVAVDDGGFIVAYRTSMGFFARWYDEDCTAHGDEFPVALYDDGSEYVGGLAALTGARVVASWRTNGRGDDVYIRILDRDAEVGRVGRPAHDPTSYLQALPAVAGFKDTGFLAAWTSVIVDEDDQQILAARYTEEGDRIWEGLVVNGDKVGENMQPSIAAFPDGGAAVAWAGPGPDDLYNTDVHIQLLDPAGAFDGAAQQINRYYTGMQQVPVAAAFQGRGFVVAWESFYQDGHTKGIYARRFNRDGTTCPVGENLALPQMDCGDGCADANPCTLDHCDEVLGCQHASLTNGWACGAGGHCLDGACEGETGACDDGNEDPWDGCRRGRQVEWRVYDESTGGNMEPCVAGLPDGSFAVVWSHRVAETADHQILLQAYGADRVALGVPVEVNTAGAVGHRSQPAIVAVDDPATPYYMVTWTDNDMEDGGDVAARRVFADGTPDSGGPFLVNAGLLIQNQGDSDVAWLGGDLFVATFTTANSGVGYSLSRVFGQRFHADGTLEDGNIESIPHDGSYNYSARATSLGGGGFLLAWYGTDADSSGHGIRSRAFDEDAQAIGDAVLVNTTEYDNQHHPELSALANGELLAVWDSNGQDADDHGVFARRLSAAGAPLGEEIQVNVTEDENQIHPAGALAGDGTQFVVWYGAGRSDVEYGVSFRRLDGDGVPLGEEGQAGDLAMGFQKSADVAAVGPDSVVIVWMGQRENDFSGYGEIFARRFSSQ